MRTLLQVGGWAAGIPLVVFGVAVVYMGVQARSTVREAIAEEQVKYGSADDPAVAKCAEKWAGKKVKTGEQARAFACVIREHTRARTDDLTYAQMGRFVSADDPESMAGTSNEDEALLDDDGKPVPNGARDTWVTATALTSALNMSYLAEQLSLFSIVVGVSLVLVGIGFLVLNSYTYLSSKATA